MKVLLTTAIWGAWHIDAYLRITLPTLLAKGNFPALARAHDCRYRMFTTAESLAKIENAQGMARLREIMPVDIRVIAPHDKLASDAHLVAWQHVVDEANVVGSAVVSIHPDAPWSNGSFEFMARELSAGKEVFVVPNVRVISETIVPVMAAACEGEAITISGAGMSELALRHLHPLSISMVPKAGYSASGTEIYWGVPGQGLSLRHASRPAIAAIPRKVPLDIQFYTRKIDDLDSVFNVTNVQQMFMLSLAPLFKDYGLLTLEHEVTPLLIGRWCAHPQNDTPLKDYFARQSLRLPLNRKSDSSAWQSAERDADAFMDEVSVNLAAVNLHYEMRNQKCLTAANILSLALHETKLAQKIECPPLGSEGVVLVPSDRALEKYGKEKIEILATPGSEKKLLDLLLLHYRPDWRRSDAEAAVAAAGITIESVTSTDRLSVLIIDRVVVEAL